MRHSYGSLVVGRMVLELQKQGAAGNKNQSILIKNTPTRRPLSTSVTLQKCGTNIRAVRARRTINNHHSGAILIFLAFSSSEGKLTVDEQKKKHTHTHATAKEHYRQTTSRDLTDRLLHKDFDP